jgi:cytochrome c biogenesis protein
MNYMQSVMLDGSYVFLSGVRENPNEQFHYLRMPADDNDSLEEWMRLRAALSNPALRAQAAAQYAKRVLPEDSDQKVREQLAASATKEMYVFAGEGNDKGLAGLAAVDLFLKELPVADQNKATDIFIKILNGSMWELWQLARKNEGLSAIETNEKHARFLQLAIVSLSEAFSYGAPVYLQLTGFEEIKASVFQVTRAPGQNVVYLGCLFLIMGVFAMFYIRERRLWIWIKHEANGSQVLMALSSQRKTLDFEREFEILRSDLTGQAKTEVQVAPITNK